MKSPPAQKVRNSRRFAAGDAFTLVELMVVIAIILILAALAFPVQQRMVGAAKSAVCMNNMRQYGVAVLNFVADNGGRLPNRSPEIPQDDRPPLAYAAWMKDYLGKPVSEHRCPLANAEDLKKTTGFGYVGSGPLTEYFPSLKNIPAPASKIVLAAEMFSMYDGFWVSGHFNRTVWGNGNGYANPEDEGTARRPQYHGSKEQRGLHMFLLDGHVELISAPDNDWGNSPTLGNATNGGYFYTSGQFSSLSRGKYVVH